MIRSRSVRMAKDRHRTAQQLPTGPRALARIGRTRRKAGATRKRRLRSTRPRALTLTGRKRRKAGATKKRQLRKATPIGKRRQVGAKKLELRTPPRRLSPSG